MPKETTPDEEAQDDDPWIPLGGGAINERKRTALFGGAAATAATANDRPSSLSFFQPATTKSHLWHALEGMDRYPSYLSRWSVDDMNRLEDSLELQLARVRQQKEQVLARREGIQKLVDDFVQTNEQWRQLLQPPTDWDQVRRRILDPRASQAFLNFQQQQPQHAATQTHTHSTPTVEQVMQGTARIDLNVSKLAVLMDEEMYDIFSFPLLSLDFCRQLREFVAALHSYGQTNKKDYASLLVGRRPVDLDTVGFGWLNDLLFQLVLKPVSRHLFQSSETLQDLDWRQGYVAGYSARPSEGKPRERLATHTDDSEVTLNVCLGDESFQGGLLEFRGLRGTEEEGQLVGTFAPQPGLALIHAGRHFHHVTQVTAGDRFAYVIWARSWQGIRAQSCPCCWLNRRQDKSCVCGPRWN